MDTKITLLSIYFAFLIACSNGCKKEEPSKNHQSEAFKYEKPTVQQQTTTGLGNQEQSAYKRDIIAATHSNWHVRRRAIISLGEIELPTNEVVLTLFNALSDYDSSVAKIAERTLIQMGGPAVPVLRGILNDRSKHIVDRRVAMILLGRIGNEAHDAIQTIVETLAEERKDFELAAHFALANIKEKPEEHIQILTNALKSQNVERRAEAIAHLGLLAGKAKSAIPLLIDALNDKDSRCVIFARFALIRNNVQSDEHVHKLLQIWKEELEIHARQISRAPESATMLCAEFALRNVGSNAVPALAQGLSHSDVSIGSYCAEILGYIGPDAKDGVPLLAQALKDKNARVRECSAEALGYIGSAAKTAVPALIEHFGTSEQEAIRGLIMIGPEAKASVPILTKALDGENRRDAIEALARIGPEAKSAVRYLIQILNDGEEWIPGDTVWALRKITGQDFGTDQTKWLQWYKKAYGEPIKKLTTGSS